MRWATLLLAGWILGARALLQVPFALAGAAAGTGEAPADPQAVVRAAWQIVSEQYFDEKFGGVSWDQALLGRYLKEAAAPGADGYAVASRMVAELKDPGTFIIDPATRRQLEQQGVRINVVGIGVLLIEGPEGYPVIGQVLPGGAAADARLPRGLLITAVDGWATKDQPLDQVASRVRGEAGTRVRLDLERPGGGRRQVELTRRPVSVEPKIESRTLPDNIGYIYLPHFGTGMETAFLGELRKLYRTRALILDLRFSQGAGSLETLSHIAGLLTNQWLGILVFRQGVVALPAQKAESSDNPLIPAPTSIDFYDKPVAVLVDGGTTFAVLAFALRANGRAVVVGRPTPARAGDQQAYFELPGGGLIGVTAARFHSAAGRPLVGPVVPDITVPIDREFLKAWESGSDLDIQRAIELLRRRGAI
ncbi:MAG: S41 family peptidase [Bacillota bacterium]